VTREDLALKVRERCIRLAAKGGCFIGASLSCADLLVHLYTSVLRVEAGKVSDPDRDYLFLSKGHDVPALYATLAELGFFDPERLENHLETTDCVYWHPNRGVPGVEFHSGSLGHLLSVAIGVALDIRLRGGKNRVFVVLGDGELDEGSVWEACLVASAKKLTNLVAIVDRNAFQANLMTEDLLPLEPLPAKFEAFGWGCRTVDGHDFGKLDEVFSSLDWARPTAILAKTLRGKGVASIEGKADRWFCQLSEEEAESLVSELRGEGVGCLESEGMTVR